MKTPIALLAILIVGSSAGLSSPLTNILDAATVTTQCIQLLSSLKNKISQTVLDADNLIDEPLEEIANAVEELSAAALGAAIGFSGDALTQIQSVVVLLANLSIPPGSALFATTTNNLTSQLTALVNPLIQTLNSKILSGAVRLQCFTKVVPKITGNITEVVANTAEGIRWQIDEDFPVIKSHAKEIENQLEQLTEEFQACRGGTICVLTAVRKWCQLDVTYNEVC